MKVSATLKGRKDAFGRLVVNIRINDGYTRKFQSTGIRVHPDQWKGKVKASHPNHKRLNEKIKELIDQTETKLLNKENYPDALFSTYVTQCLNQWDKSRKWSTLQKLKSLCDKVTNFQDVYLSEMNFKFLARYQKYLESKGNKTNTIWASFKFIRLILRKAHREKVIRENPFDVFEMPKYRDPQKVFLTLDQVHEIENKDLPKELKTVATWFVIGCYTGLRYSDMQAFNKKKIKNGRLMLYTVKTGEPVSIPLTSKLKELFELVNYQPLNYHNAYSNKLIKQVASICEIDEHISFHTSRHTFATLLASKGVSMEVTAKMMGLTSLKTVAIYYKITNTAIDKEFQKLF